MSRSALQSLFRSNDRKADAHLPLRSRARRPSSCSSRQLAFELLEDRCMLAIFTVSNLNDAAVTMPGSAPGTLRQAIFDANNLAGLDKIVFAAGLSGDVNLSVIGDSTSGPSALLVTSPITIGGNANGITIKRSPAAQDMRLFRVAANGDLTLESIALSGGNARGTTGTVPGENGGDGKGGAVFNQGTLQIVASTLYDNQALGGDAGFGDRAGAGLGGAVYNDGGTISIVNATLSTNTVQSGAGATTPTSFGGSIYGMNGSLTIHNATITNNTAPTGRGIYLIAFNGTAAANIQSSVIGQSDVHAQVVEFIAAEDTGGQITVTGANNLIRSQNDYQAITASNADPLLGSLSSNGGPTPTHALLANSPAINLGNNSLNLTTDQRGPAFTRVIGGTSDIGAFELQSAAGPVLTGDYNQNQIVDGADYVLWRKTQGTNVSQYSGADGNGDSTVDDADYNVWRSHFGEPLAAAASSSVTVTAAAKNESATIPVAPTIRALVDAAVPQSLDLKATTSRVSMQTSRTALAEPRYPFDFALLALSEFDLPKINLKGKISERPCPQQGATTSRQDRDPQLLDAVWAAWPTTSESLF